MGNPLSNDLRSRVARAVAGGLTRCAAAAQFGVSPASVVRWVEAVPASGSVEPKSQGGDTRSHRVGSVTSWAEKRPTCRTSSKHVAELCSNGTSMGNSIMLRAVTCLHWDALYRSNESSRDKMRLAVLASMR